MRIGASSSGRWWVSMGPLGWLLTFWFVIPVTVACCLLVLIIRAGALACRAAAAYRARNG